MFNSDCTSFYRLVLTETLIQIQRILLRNLKNAKRSKDNLKLKKIIEYSISKNNTSYQSSNNDDVRIKKVTKYDRSQKYLLNSCAYCIRANFKRA